MRVKECLVASLFVAALLCIHEARADNLLEDFDSWDRVAPSGTYTNAGWTMTCFAVTGSPPISFSAHTNAFGGVVNAVFLSRRSDANGTNQWLQTPQLTSGVGAISFWIRNSLTAATNFFEVQTLTAADSNWLTRANFAHPTNAWLPYQLQLNEYGPTSVRILKTGELRASFMGIDDVAVSNPPAYVTFSNVVTDPSVPYVNSNIHIQADIAPYAGASNLTASLYYRIGRSGGWTYDPMSRVAGNTFRTLNAIPGQSYPGTPVQYFVQVSFLGQFALSPVNDPPGGSSDPATFLFRVPSPLSSSTNMTLTGSLATNLLLVEDYTWQGMVALSTNIVSAPFKFSGKFGGQTVLWGDTNPPAPAMPLLGLAETNGPNIAIPGTNGGYLAFLICETNGEYTVQRCAHASFDGWNGAASGFGTYTNEGWVMGNARTTTGGDEQVDKAFGGQGRSCILSDSGSASYLLSPHLTNGVGEFSFRYRNWEIDAYPPAGFSVQASPNGTSDWQNVDTVTNILAMDYLYGSYALSDLSKHYVRILNSTNSPHARLCLDQVTVAEPGPRVAFTNQTRLPAAPTVLDAVTVAVGIIPISGAADIEATTWYRAGTNGTFLPTPMVNTGGVTYVSAPPVPQGPVGVMQYYVECSFRGLRSGTRVTVYDPPNGAFQPLAYTNTDAGYFTQNFETWTRQFVFATTTNDNWIANDATVKGTPPAWQAPHGGINAAWLQRYSLSTNAWLLAPLLSNGVGTITFWARVASPSDYDDTRFELQSLPEGTNAWITLTSLTAASTSWQEYRYGVHDPRSMYLRLMKTGELGSPAWTNYLGIDDVSITRPPATVAISDVQSSPGYPAQDRPVDVSCQIASSNTVFPAFNISARIFYRKKGAATFSGPAEMTGNGSHFAGSIPPVFVAGDIVQYYIESRFDGYRAVPADSMSPTFYPAGIPYMTNTQMYLPPTNYLTYTVREFLSEYDHVALSLSTNAEIYTWLLGDRTWQSIATFSNEVVDPSVLFSGYGRFTGTNYDWSAPRTWGDNYQLRSALPLSGTAQQDGTSVVMRGLQFGQYVIRFNELDLSYTIQRCAFQDFDNWAVDPLIFKESFSKGNIAETKLDFDSWPTNSLDQRPEDFQTWALMSDYSPGMSESGSVGWIIFDAKITNQFNNNHSCRFMPAANYGAALPNEFNLPDGVGSFDFDFHCADDTFVPTLYADGARFSNSIVYATLQATAVPTNPSLTSWDTGSKISILSRYQDANNFYELALLKTGSGNSQSAVLYRMRGGVRTALWSEGAADMGTPLNYGLMTCNYNGTNNVLLEVYRDSVRRTQYGDVAAGILAQAGSIGLNTEDADIIADNVSANWAEAQAFASWNYPSYIGSSTNDGWVAFHGWTQNDYMRLCTNQIGQLAKPSVRTPRLPCGIGVVRFGYQKQSGNPTTLRVQWSATGGTNNTEWTDFAGVSNITDVAYHDVVVTNTIATSNVYVRIVNETNTIDGKMAIMIVDTITIEGAPGFNYTEDFSDNLAQGWAASGYWYVTNNAYLRPGYAAPPLSFAIQTTWYNPPPAPNIHIFVEGNWTTWYTYTNLNNTPYRTVSFPFQFSERKFVRVKHTGGAGSLVLDNMNISSWHGENNADADGWTATPSWIVPGNDASTTGKYCELRPSRAYAAEEQYLQSPWMTNGIGSISFYQRGSDTQQVSFIVEKARSGLPDYWIPVAAFTNSSMVWKPDGYVSCTLNEHAQLRIRIRNTTQTNATALFLDEIRITDYFERDESAWVAYNALITPMLTNKLWVTRRHPTEKTAYLNRGPGPYPPDTPQAWLADAPNIQSPRLPRGIGEVSFWYRNWGDAPYTQPSSLRIKAAPVETTPLSEWVTLAAITNITSKQFQYFSTTVYDTSNRYLRVYCDTNGAAGRACIDDLLITEAFGADITLTNLTINPGAPIAGDPVSVTVDLYDFFLQPSNIHVYTYYHIGSEPWGTWEEENPIPMRPVATNGNRVTYSTAGNGAIPPQAVDAVVQYYVKCDFEGLFSELSSPKVQKDFVNPPWYFPVDLNSGKSNASPYYIVLSCRPGEVWINELNVVDTAFYPGALMQYVELCGRAGVNVSNWWLQVYDINMNTLGHYPITTQTQFANQTNGFGFWVLGDAATPNRYATLTNNLPLEGGIRLYRSMGAIEHAVCYDTFSGGNGPLLSGAPYYFEYIGYDSDSWNGPLSMAGSGSNRADFVWVNNSFAYTPGFANSGQNLIGENTVPGTVEIYIVDFRVAGSNALIVFTGTNTFSPQVFFATNLPDQHWYAVPNVTGTYANGIYTQHFTVGGESDVHYYRIGTNAP